MKRLLAIVIALALCLSGCGPQLRPLGDGSALLEAPATPDPNALHGLPQLETEEHIPYIKARTETEFDPEGLVTRGEAAQIFYNLVSNPIEGRCAFGDLSPQDDCYEAVAGLTAWGVFRDSSGDFDPDGLFSRAQLMTILAAFYPPAGKGRAPYVGSFFRQGAKTADAVLLPGISSFSDISDHWACEAIENAVTRNWIHPGGEFGPDVAVTRAELCQLLNRVLDRHADIGTITVCSDIPKYTDVSTAHEAYGDIMEASFPHGYFREDGRELWKDVSLTPGFHRVQGRLYYVDENAQLVRNESYGVWYFDDNGCYTTGVSATDAALAEVLMSLGTDTMDDWDALKAVYRYCVEGKYYMRRPWFSYGCPNDRDEFAYRALSFMEHNSGSCYDFASAFGLLARSLGYRAYIVFARINNARNVHGWVVIPENGVNYIYDTELEAVRPWHYRFELFRSTNHQVYDYYYSPWW